MTLHLPRSLRMTGMGAVGLLAASTIQGCSSAPDQNELLRTVAAAYPECTKWESMPEDTMVFPGVELDWMVGCQSQAAVTALRDPAQICDLWDKSGQAPEEFVASRDGRVLLMDLNGINQDQALEFADNNPDDFARATVATFCAPDGWKPETPDDVRARLAADAERESTELERQRQEEAAELERQQQAAQVAA